jgi:formylglycine-generating enzyme required for sulfatase activity
MRVAMAVLVSRWWALSAALLAACGPKCTDGREASGGYCCWPGQRWSDEREACVGTPRCPSGTKPRAGGCMGPVPVCPAGMVGIGAASFHMGTNRSGDDWNGSRPVRLVKVNAFCMDRTEVTVAA